MIGKTKNQKAILDKLGIEQLNEMQESAQRTIIAEDETVLLSPTGTGKTVAFLLPLIAGLDQNQEGIQALILVPSRELAIQIEQVIRQMGSGYKINAVYGGRSGTKDKMELKHAPAILVGTPGRVADHLRRENIDAKSIRTLVLDEFDKSLEIGFEEEMTEIMERLPALQKKILTSATQRVEVPGFVRLRNPTRLDFIKEGSNLLSIKIVNSPIKDKLDTLIHLLGFIESGRGIIFCNYKDSIRYVSDFLTFHNISHAYYYGGLEQKDREHALLKFRNNTHDILLATDLAARGIDVPELDFIIHFQLPPKQDEFTHRNGRTARMKSNGTAYVIKWIEEALPDFITESEEIEVGENKAHFTSNWTTLYISGGRKDKISKGDIAGLFLRQGNLKKDELGIIELKQEWSFVSVPKKRAESLIKLLNNSKLKKKKVRISHLD